MSNWEEIGDTLIPRGSEHTSDAAMPLGALMEPGETIYIDDILGYSWTGMEQFAFIVTDGSEPIRQGVDYSPADWTGWLEDPTSKCISVVGGYLNQWVFQADNTKWVGGSAAAIDQYPIESPVEFYMTADRKVQVYINGRLMAESADSFDCAAVTLLAPEGRTYSKPAWLYVGPLPCTARYWASISDPGECESIIACGKGHWLYQNPIKLAEADVAMSWKAAAESMHCQVYRDYSGFSVHALREALRPVYEADRELLKHIADDIAGYLFSLDIGRGERQRKEERYAGVLRAASVDTASIEVETLLMACTTGPEETALLQLLNDELQQHLLRYPR